MEYSNFYIRSSSIKSSFNHNKRFLRSANLIREYRDYPFYDHVKRNIKGAIVNSETNSENDNANNLITYEHSSSESWLDLVLPFTILGITILGVVLIGVILFIWIRKYFSETNEKSQESARLECEKEKKYKEKLNRRMMNSRKWLKGKNKKVNNQAVDDLEQKLENIEHKSSPPTSPNFQKQNEDVASLSSDDSDSECVGNVIKKHDDDDNADNKSPKSNPIILPCPLAISDFSSVASLVHPQPCGQTNESQVQQIKSSSTSSLSFLQEEVHCIQPREDQTSKIYKSIATSPPPFSPIVHQHTSQTYATQGTQTYFTKAPNSPNNHLLSSSFAVVQTPTTSTIPSGNPFLTPSSPSSYNNKENKEPSVGRLRNTCLNKSISNFKQDNGASTATTTTTTSLPSSPSSVLSTSPKLNTNVLQPQNSPIIQQQQQQSSSGESPPPSINRQFNFSPKIQSNNSPTISSANYKFGNYFRFPDVGSPPLAQQHQQSSISATTTTSEDSTSDAAIKSFQNLSMESDKESIILKIDEVESPVNDNNNKSNNNNNNNNENTLTIRRARLKSISLDSDGARLVEENLTMPVEELVEIASYNNKQITDSDPSDSGTSSSANNNNNNINNNIDNDDNRYNPKNINNLTINLDFRDSSLDMTESSDINMNQDQEFDEIEDDGICRTPTMKYFQKKKAASLDSDNHHQHHHHHHQNVIGGGNKSCATGKTASSETFNYYFGQGNGGKLNSSISVPSTPKHLIAANKLKISYDGGSRHNNKKLGSFEESNSTDSKKHHLSTTSQVGGRTNFTASIQTLNVSSSNLKTLPEIMSITDFDGNQSPSKGPLRIGPPSGIAPSKSGILQRRGSNHSLTLNIDGSCGNLARGLSSSNYSLGNIHGSHLSIAGSNSNLPNRVSIVKKNLLQRRGSNTSLTLNIQEPRNNLNRFNSHSSLNIGGSRKGLLERRNSNTSLTLNIQNRGLSISNCNLRGSECSLSSVNTNQMAEMMMMEQEAEQEAEEQAAKERENSSSKRDQRKFLSSENLHKLSAQSRVTIGAGHHEASHHPTPFGSSDNLKHTPTYQEKLTVITTQPLSPQSTSEDFKCYLANIQLLQNASSVLNAEHLKTLHGLFQKSYKNRSRIYFNEPFMGPFSNDDFLSSRLGPISFFSSSPNESQKELLIKVHQEFWHLPTNYQDKPMIFGTHAKNRYKTILPNEHSRVILHKEEGCDQEPYINANYIKGPDYSTDRYIATQGPMENTVYEFWIMILQNIQKHNGEGIQKMIMLTDFLETNRHKCEVYFPTKLDDHVIFTNTEKKEDEDVVKENLEKIFDPGKDEIDDEEGAAKDVSKIKFHFFAVKNIAVCEKDGYSIRKLKIHYGDNLMKNIYRCDLYHYWFRDWPDHRSPKNIDVLIDMSLDYLDRNCVKDFDETADENAWKNGKHPLPIIHCSAGIGRTGCFAGILNALGQIRANPDDIAVDVLGIVCNLRLNRGGMVQNSEQYELIHRTICLYHHRISQK